jgi:H2-forming N5,N10-methylenetetrahydromethanopterin dehydrogenase-like enzyme
VKYTTKVTLECSCGLGQQWTIEEATIQHEMILPYNRLRDEAIKLIGGKYVTYGIMLIIDEG